jgi:hypothetical protein
LGSKVQGSGLTHSAKRKALKTSRPYKAKGVKPFGFSIQVHAYLIGIPTSGFLRPLILCSKLQAVNLEP